MSNPIDPVWGFKLSEKELADLQVAKDAPVPTQLPHLKRLEETLPLSDDDLKCFHAIKEVLLRHGKLDRFGVCLLHSHFDMKDGEVLIESSDSKDRTMTLEPKIIDTTEIDSIDTQWYLGSTMPLSLVKCRTSLHIEK